MHALHGGKAGVGAQSANKALLCLEYWLVVVGINMHAVVFEARA